MNIKSLQANEDLSAEGVWVPLGAGARIRVAHINNKKYQTWMKDALRRSRRAVRTSDVDVLEELTIDGMSRFVLLEWENLQWEDGKTDIPVNVENAKRLLAIPEFKRIVVETANDLSLYQEDDIEEAKGN